MKNLLASNRAFAAVIIIAAIGFALGAYFYPGLPDRIPTHWNIHSEIDAYMDKSIAIYIMPMLLLVMGLFFIVLPVLDPLRKNYAAFMPYFEGFIVLFSVFLLYMHVLTIMAGLGFEIKMNFMLLPAMAILFLYLALLMRKSKRNWFIGIRTPWTMSSDLVWEKTHKFGSICFAVMAIIIFLLAFLESALAFAGLIIAVIALGLAPAVYSYFAWKEEQKPRGKKPAWK
ncbi:MAG: SdpI family protein [Candidatus Diapherotrites archaeon]|nr:SdpI family protein [Candidatus Diapherotrites archaeon]